MPYLFSYGSNSPRQLSERLGRTISGEAAYIDNYLRAFRGWSGRWEGGVATLIPGAGRTFGYIAEVNEDDLRILDRYEGTPRFYRRHQLTARRADQAPVEVIAYLATSQEKNAPSDEYLEAVAETIGTFWSEDGRKVTKSDITVRNPVALDNGIFPLQYKVVERVRKAWRDVGPMGYTTVNIPWSDFVFSNTDPWPKSYQQGLKNYLNFLAQWQEAPHVAPEVTDPELVDLTFKWSNRLKTSLSRKQILQLAESLPTLTLDDIHQIFQSDYHTLLGTKVVGSNGKIYRWSYFNFAADIVDRQADKSGFELCIIGPKRAAVSNGLITSRYVKGANILEFGTSYDLVVKSSANKEALFDTFMHECMHLVQIVGGELILSLREPQKAFIGWMSPVGLPKKPDITRSSYFEEPMEFYPLAFTYSKTKISNYKDVFDDGDIANALSAIADTRHRLRFLESVYRYAMRQLDRSEDISDEVLRYIGKLATGDLDTVADWIAVRIVRHKKKLLPDLLGQWAFLRYRLFEYSDDLARRRQQAYPYMKDLGEKTAEIVLRETGQSIAVPYAKIESYEFEDPILNLPS